MAAVTPRFYWQNFCELVSAVVTASSEQTSMPARFAKTQMRSEPWASKLGWNVVTGGWDKLDFKEDGVARVATLTAGNYATGSAAAAQVQAAMNAAPSAVNTYTVTYSGSTFKFTIARATGSAALVLAFSTGVNLARSAHHDLGFSDADKSGSASYVGDTSAYKSREWLTFDLGSTLDVKSGIVTDHSFATGDTLKLLGNSSDSWAAPATTQTLAGDATIRRLDFSLQSYRYWRLLCDDVGNSLGYTSIGKPSIGSYLQPSRAHVPAFARDPDELSENTFADHGAHYWDDKPSRETWAILFNLIPEAERESFMAMRDYVRVGRSFFMALDPQNYPLQTYYVFLSQGMGVRHDPAQTLRWVITMTIKEALG
jgi:hypothetical protein